MNLRTRLRECASEYTENDLIIYNAIENDYSFVIRADSNAISRKYGVSAAALTRFAKRFGYVGFTDFRYDLQREQYTDDRSVYKYQVYAEVMHEIERQYPEKKLQQIADLLYSADRIFVTGYHVSALPAQNIEMDLTLFGYDVHFMPADRIFKVDAFARKNDLLIDFSVAGDAARELMETVNNMGENKPKTILFGMNPKHPLRNKFDYYFRIPDSHSVGSSEYLDPCILFYYFIDHLSTILKTK